MSLSGSASPVATRFVNEDDAMRSAAKETVRDRLVDTAFKNVGVPAREDVATIELEAMMMLLIVDEWWGGQGTVDVHRAVEEC